LLEQQNTNDRSNGIPDHYLALANIRFHATRSVAKAALELSSKMLQITVAVLICLK
jgi:hypothetical protein